LQTGVVDVIVLRKILKGADAWQMSAGWWKKQQGKMESKVIFIRFFRLGLTAFGGGASLPIMFNAVVNQRAWMNSHTFMNCIVLGQITPGPIVITATFLGYFLYGPLGAVIATIFIFLSYFMLLVGIEPYFSRLRRSLYFNRAVQGVLCSLVGLLISVAIQFAMKISWDTPRILLACVAVGALSLDVDIAWIVLAGGIISAIIL
jgi:chromate transporter